MADPAKDDDREPTGADRPEPDPRFPHRYDDDPDDPWAYHGFQT